MGLIDEYTFKWVMYPVGRFLHEVTGVATYRLAKALVIVGYATSLAVSIVNQNWFSLIITPLVAAWVLTSWSSWFGALEDLGAQELLPVEYYNALIYRKIMNIIWFVFFVLDVAFLSFDGYSVSSFLVVLGINILTMLWPQRPNWFRVKYRQLHAALNKKPAPVMVS